MTGETLAAGQVVIRDAAHPRLSLNQATIKYASLRDALEVTQSVGIEAIGLWREPVAEVGLQEAARMLRDSGLRMSSLCRGGFFTAPVGADLSYALDENRRAIEEAATLADAAAAGSRAVVVLVAGGLPPGSRDLVGARQQVADALEVLAPEAAAHGVRIAIEPLHPMYAADRAVVSTLQQALNLAAPHDPAAVGVVVDAFHVWWDPALADSIARAGNENRIASYQVCDWLTPIAADPLLSRGIPGDGHIDFVALTGLVDAAGYTGDVEVEVFNQAIWDTAYGDVAARVVAAVGACVPLGGGRSAR